MILQNVSDLQVISNGKLGHGPGNLPVIMSTGAGQSGRRMGIIGMAGSHCGMGDYDWWHMNKVSRYGLYVIATKTMAS